MKWLTTANVLGVVGAAFLALALLSIGKTRALSGAARTWFLVAVVFLIVSAWLKFGR